MFETFVYVLMVGLIACAYATYNYFKIKNMPEGNERMQEIAQAIREGANAFLNCEYKVLIKVLIFILIFIAVFTQWECAVAVLFGTLISALPGKIGMSCSTNANVRVTETARKTKHIGKTTKVAFRGGSVMGLFVGGFAMIGLTCIFVFFYRYTFSFDNTVNWMGVSIQKFSLILSSFGLGCSIIALFNRVGGGIYTKGADMGSDSAGKNEFNIPEDDRRNPGAICDNVGDNVGDTCGLGSDILESFVQSIVSATVLTIFIFNRYQAQGLKFDESLFRSLYLYPIIFCVNGLLASMIGIAFVLIKPVNADPDKDDPHKTLNYGTYISASLTALFNFITTYVLFNKFDFGDLPFKYDWISLFIAPLLGIISGVIIGALSEYYTSYSYKPTLEIVKVSKEGPALNVTEGMSVGMKSILSQVCVLAGALILSYVLGGFLGTALTAVGMLSFTAITVSVDTYGPISDNAGGIAEMAKLHISVRRITDFLDAVGNTTAAIGKGFAIGSASYATISLMISYLCAFLPITADISLNIMDIWTFSGMLIGGALIFFFSGTLIHAVSEAANTLVEEIRRQFREIPGLIEDKEKPNYKECVGIVTRFSLKEMKAPSCVAVVFPVLGGFIFGPYFVAGSLIGEILTAILLAIFCGISGGAWDNCKKYIEAQGGDGVKNTLEHIAAVVGDTCGDPLKDTVGPSLDIFIKISASVALIMVPIFSKYNLKDFIANYIH